MGKEKRERLREKRQKMREKGGTDNTVKYMHKHTHIHTHTFHIHIPVFGYEDKRISFLFLTQTDPPPNLCQSVLTQFLKPSHNSLDSSTKHLHYLTQIIIIIK